MPNWCDNRMTLTNDDVSKIDALEVELQKKNDEGRFMAQPFNHLRPQPADVGDDWYGWNCNNWGTKWDANLIDYDRSDDNTITIYCDTAWSPPIALYEYLTEEGWTVDAVYHECGMCYAGTYTSDDGDNYYEYDVTDSYSIEELPSEVQDFAGLEDAHANWKEEAINDYMGDLERTDWFPPKTKPVHVGRYEVTTKSWNYPQWCSWTGTKWQRWEGDDIKVAQWRGLTEEFTDVKYQEMLDTIAENN